MMREYLYAGCRADLYCLEAGSEGMRARTDFDA